MSKNWSIHSCTHHFLFLDDHGLIHETHHDLVFCDVFIYLDSLKLMCSWSWSKPFSSLYVSTSFLTSYKVLHVPNNLKLHVGDPLFLVQVPHHLFVLLGIVAYTSNLVFSFVQWYLLTSLSNIGQVKR